MTAKKEQYKILINAVDPEECRIALVRNGNLENFSIETTAGELTRGNIYKGKITRVEPSLQAAFVDYGAEKNAFLQRHDIHSDYFAEKPKGSTKKQPGFSDLIKPGQELLVQVTKEPMLHKGSMVTTFISLPGRYTVLMPGAKSSGISRQIADEEERKRLKDIIASLKIPEGVGTIVRTAGYQQSKRDISKDVRYLLRLWENIKKRGMSTPAPCLLYKERHLAIRAIRDMFTTDVTEILVDDKAVYKDVKEFMRIISPKQTHIVKLHNSPKPIFTKHELENQISSIFDNKVSLPSGGHVVINPTEALVAIDVNSGKSTREGSIEKTAYSTNMEAAAEIARQLRLRDLGGLIVVDFIDMKDRKHKQAVVKAVKDHTKLDKARIAVGTISKFGLLELSRQRITASIEYGSFIPCPHCNGKGLVPSAERLALDFMRKLRLEILKNDTKALKGIVPGNVADYLQNKKRRELLDVEMKQNLTITIEGDANLHPGESRIVRN